MSKDRSYSSASSSSEADTSSSPEKCEDLITLSEVNEEIILDVIKSRFAIKSIYTSIGTVLLVVNPFQKIPGILGQDVIARYFEHSTHVVGKSSVGGGSLPAHVYLIPGRAYSELCASNQNQSILISGESGAGKTEATKQCLGYLTSIASTPAPESDSSGNGSAATGSAATGSAATIATATVADRIIASSPILEAFGNAQTTRNPNSSRFGKYMEVMFKSTMSGAGDDNVVGGGEGPHMKIVGSRIVSYLLEKSRITQRDVKERNYHVFYGLVYGGSDQILGQLYLHRARLSKGTDGVGVGVGVSGRDMNCYNYLATQSTTDPAAFVQNQSTVFRDETLPAFRAMNFSDSDIQAVCQVLAGILHLGNVAFTATNQDEECEVTADADSSENTQYDTGYREKHGVEPIAVESPSTTSGVAAVLLGLDRTSLEGALCSRTISTGNAKRSSVTVVPLNVSKAKDGRDSLARGVYNRLFNYIIARINESNSSNKGADGSDEASTDGLRSIGLLDIFGFEIFQANSFEQLCINYCNEMLQNHFNYVIFTLEKQIYADEGIVCEVSIYSVACI